MNAPTYDWTCQKCGMVNSAHTDKCAECGFSANFRMADLPVSGKVVPSENGMDEQDLGRALWMFLPEAIPAFILALYAPFWAIRMFANGEALPAVFLMVGELAGGYGFIQGWRFSRKWISYGSMLAFLLLGYVVHSVVK